MSFDVYLIPTTASPEGDEVRAATDRALALCGARRGGPEECDYVLASGYGQEFFGGDDGSAGGVFALRGLDAERAHVIFEIADATQCFIIAAQEDCAPMRTPGNFGAAPGGDETPQIIDIADPAELVAYLEGGLDAWSDYRNGAVRHPKPNTGN